MAVALAVVARRALLALVQCAQRLQRLVAEQRREAERRRANPLDLSHYELRPATKPNWGRRVTQTLNNAQGFSLSASRYARVSTTDF